jgi:hypothetical protein
MVALVVGVASLGLAERLWSQTLSVEGTVDTEDMNVEFTDAYTNDDIGSIDPGYDKDVASCVALATHASSGSSSPTSDRAVFYTRRRISLRRMC